MCSASSAMGGMPRTMAPSDGLAGGQAGSRLLLLDAMALAYRSYYAFGSTNMTTSSGEPTAVVHGFLNTLLTLLEMRPGFTNGIIVFDAKGKNFRHTMYADYKANRSPTPPELVDAIPRIRAVLAAMGIPVLEVSGVEADDVIGTLATRTIAGGAAVDICSPDKDFMQLLQPGVRLLRPVKGSGTLVPYDGDSFHEEFGLTPDQFIDKLALEGDSSDNVPGVRGIGRVTAQKLLAEWGSLEAILENSESTKPPRARTALCSKEGRDAAQLSKQLVTIRTALSSPQVEVPWEESRLGAPHDMAALGRILEDLELRTHSARIRRLWGEF